MLEVVNILILRYSNAIILPIVYLFYPETSLRCLEEMDYIFFTANSSRHPWLDVRRIAAAVPLWYARDEPEHQFDYEESDWHKRHVRFSDEVKDSDGGTTTLSPTSVDDEHAPRDYGDQAAPSPNIGRTDVVDAKNRPRSWRKQLSRT